MPAKNSTASSGSTPAEPARYRLTIRARPGRPVAVRLRLLLKAMLRLGFVCTDIAPEAPAQQGDAMREITTHKANGCNEALTVTVLDEPGRGGACHAYRLEWAGKGSPDADLYRTDLRFQDGPVAEAGTNGVTHEALLAVLIDRLQGFQAGPYRCRENALALTKLEEALHWLNHLRRERLARGVGGAHRV